MFSFRVVPHWFRLRLPELMFQFPILGLGIRFVLGVRNLMPTFNVSFLLFLSSCLLCCFRRWASVVFVFRILTFTFVSLLLLHSCLFQDFVSENQCCDKNKFIYGDERIGLCIIILSKKLISTLGPKF